MTTGRGHRYALPPGHRLGEYCIDRYLGSGGFGITYLATDENLNLQVAIKEYLPSDLAMRDADNSVVVRTAQDEDDFEWGRERFLDEARSLARFNHPNIVRVQRFFEAHGTSYIVMDYVEGEPLSDLLQRKGTLTETEIHQLVLPLAKGLAHIHYAGLLHRDITPSNIIIREDGTPVLIDFGSARQAVGMKSRSMTSVVKPGYAPLEQYATKSRQGPATDIYAFGAVLYHCLTGKVPDDATDRAIEDTLIPAAQGALGDYSKGMLAAVDSAMALRMEDRPQSMTAFLSDLGEPEVWADSAVSGKASEASNASKSDGSADIIPKESNPRPPSFRYGLAMLGLAVVVLGALLPLEVFVLSSLFIPDSSRPDGSRTIHKTENQETIQKPPAPGTGAVTVTTSPRDAWIEYDGRRLANGTPVTLDGLPVGELELTLGAKEHHSAKVRLTIQHNRTTSIHRELERIPYGTLTLQLMPKEAVVTLPEVRPAYRPGMMLPEGLYWVVVQYPGYQPITKVVEVSGDTRTRIELEPVPLTVGGAATGEKSAAENSSSPDGHVPADAIRVSGQNRGGTFTRGSHQDEVLRLQGTPTNIIRMSGSETWLYGASSVEISTATKRVTGWSNLGGNLNVQLLPGSNVTKAPAFTRGSHQDDVLRLQGTPTNIIRMTGSETWLYGASSVEISTATKRVTGWSNLGRNLKVHLVLGS